ncbi:MAG TPA: hypothetical protein PLU72_19780 [Candidatus Ozemobacteraceae bacterium]|nr:hypothetical protein [Candidatus Ozemobacteraceae bacterium]
MLPEQIDVLKTVNTDVLEDPYSVYVILRAIDEEAAGEEVKLPPDDENIQWLLWCIRGQDELPYVFLKAEEYPPEKLIPFAKLDERRQQKILYRAYYLYMRLFQFKGRKEKLPLVALNHCFPLRWRARLFR